MIVVEARAFANGSAVSRVTSPTRRDHGAPESERRIASHDFPRVPLKPLFSTVYARLDFRLSGLLRERAGLASFA